MTTLIWLRDIGSFSVQLAIVITVGAVLARLWRIHHPKVMLAYWRSLLLACLILPACQEWRTARSTPVELPLVTIVETAAISEIAPTTVATSSVPWRREDVILLLLGSGIAARMLWLALGAWSLRRLRRTATPLVPVPRAVEEAQARVGARAAVYVSDRVSGPVSFGLIRPVIIVPPNVLDMNARLQQAIAYHELLHVRRRDWIDEIFEEIVRTVFWFHPAVRWLLARVRLSREQVVDQAVIRLTESRESYVEALLAVALAKSPVTLVPAPLFFRRGLLKQRVAHILQESTMTIRRITASLALSAAALVFVAATAARSFPLEARAEIQNTPAEEAGAPVQILRGGEHLLHGALPEYPGRAFKHRIEGDVMLDLTIDDRGEVSDARVLTGPDELRRAALESVLQWHYSPAALRSTTAQVTLRFRVPTKPEAEIPFDDTIAEKLRRADVKLVGHIEVVLDNKERTVAHLVSKFQPKHDKIVLTELEKALQDPSTTGEQREELEHKYSEAMEMMHSMRMTHAKEHRPYQGTWTLAQVTNERVPQSIVDAVMAQAGIKIGDPITEEIEKRIDQIARSLDEHMRVDFIGNDDTGRMTIRLIMP